MTKKQMKFKIIFSETFRIPLAVSFGIAIYLILKLLKLDYAATIIIIAATILGSYRLFWDSFRNLKEKRFALDYIAIVAISVSLYTGQFLVAAILALMIATGRTLEEYAVAQAKKSLTRLIERIPNEVLLSRNGKASEIV